MLFLGIFPIQRRGKCPSLDHLSVTFSGTPDWGMEWSRPETNAWRRQPDCPGSFFGPTGASWLRVRLAIPHRSERSDPFCWKWREVPGTCLLEEPARVTAPAAGILDRWLHDITQPRQQGAAHQLHPCHATGTCSQVMDASIDGRTGRGMRISSGQHWPYSPDRCKHKCTEQKGSGAF